MVKAVGGIVAYSSVGAGTIEEGGECMHGVRRVSKGVLLSIILLLGSHAEGAEQRFRGIYSAGFEVSAFIPCGGGRDAWLYDKGGQLQAAERLMADQRQQYMRAYPRVYVDFYGIDEGKGTEGFPADYDRVIRVTRLNATAEALARDCFIPDD